MTTEEYVLSQSNLDNLARIWDEAPSTFAPGQGHDVAVDEPYDHYDYNPSDDECDRAADAYEKGLGL